MKIIYKQNDTQRVDLFLSKNTKFSRAEISKLILKSSIKKNNFILKKVSEKVVFGDVIEIDKPTENVPKLLPVKMTLDIKYEDKDLIVISKPKDMVVHPSESFQENTLVNGIIYNYPQIVNVGDINRPGIVHRLDKDTSGLIIVAKNQESFIFLKGLFKNRKIKKEYLAVVHGNTPEKGIIEAPIGRHPVNKIKRALISSGKKAYTSYERLVLFDNKSLLKVNIKTGRTHQIRVHLSSIDHPIVGDKMYGNKKNMPGEYLYLHSYKLAFQHPKTKKIIKIKDTIPKSFTYLLDKNNIKNAKS